MPYTISQKQDRMKLAVSLQRKCDIEAVRLVESTARCKCTLSGERYPLSFAAEFHPDNALVLGNTFSVTTRFQFSILDRQKSEVVSIECVLAADYSLQEGFIPTDEQISAFKEGPAIHNCWPYFREHIQNVVTRMSYPPPTMPFLWVVVEPSAPITPPPPALTESSVVAPEGDRHKQRRQLRKRRQERKASEGD